MPIDIDKVDLILQYALLLAGEEDDYFDRQLGPIHLIKYVYLADLAYARRNKGQTYTGTEWTFYKFGPWAQSVNARIEPALNALLAERKVFQSDYEEREDWVRWIKRDGRRLEDIERKIPGCITGKLRLDVHRFNKDTPILLDHIYKTEPMLSAAPNELLDFALAAQSRTMLKHEEPSLRMDNLSTKKKRKIKEGMAAIREKRLAKEHGKAKLVQPSAPQYNQYDEVYEQGLEWLNSLAGPKIPEKQIVVEFDQEVWKSATRKAKDVS